MLAVYDFLPRFCPNCGIRINLDGYNQEGHYWRDADYQVYCSLSCGCGLSYQKAITQAILDAAETSGGDMKQYHS